MKISKNRILLALFIFFTAWWVYLRLTASPDSFSNNYFSGSYGVMALLGGLWGQTVAKRWGGWQSKLGRAVLVLSLGLILQEFGQVFYGYIYLIAKGIPTYPSIADIGYFGSTLLYMYGAILLAQVTGIKLSAKNVTNKILVVLIPVLGLFASYYFFLSTYVVDFSDVTKLVLDFGYPLGQAFYISIAVLTYVLSRKMLGGMMRSRVWWLLLAFVAQYVADFNFIYQNSAQAWVNAGYGDYLYFVAYLLMALALVNFGSAYDQLKAKA